MDKDFLFPFYQLNENLRPSGGRYPYYLNEYEYYSEYYLSKDLGNRLSDKNTFKSFCDIIAHYRMLFSLSIYRQGIYSSNSLEEADLKTKISLLRIDELQKSYKTDDEEMNIAIFYSLKQLYKEIVNWYLDFKNFSIEEPKLLAFQLKADYNKLLKIYSRANNVIFICDQQDTFFEAFEGKILRPLKIKWKLQAKKNKLINYLAIFSFIKSLQDNGIIIPIIDFNKSDEDLDGVGYSIIINVFVKIDDSSFERQKIRDTYKRFKKQYEKEYPEIKQIFE